MLQENAFAALSRDAEQKDLLASLEALEIPAAIVGESRLVKSTNSAFVRVAGQQGIMIDNGEFRAGSAGVVDTMNAALSDAASGERAARGLPGRPFRVVAVRIAESEEILITLQPRPLAEGAATLDLTNVEESLVRLLTDGLNLREAAEQLRMPYNTARKYVHNMLTRTGSKTQAHLVARYLGR